MYDYKDVVFTREVVGNVLPEMGCHFGDFTRRAFCLQLNRVGRSRLQMSAVDFRNTFVRKYNSWDGKQPGESGRSLAKTWDAVNNFPFFHFLFPCFDSYNSQVSAQKKKN